MYYLCDDCKIIIDDEVKCENCGGEDISEVYTSEDVNSIQEQMIKNLYRKWLSEGKTFNKKSIKNFAKDYGVTL